MARTEEITGGMASFPIASGAWTASHNYSIAGFILPDGGAVTGITFSDGVDYLTMFGEDYSTCQEGIYYHFPMSVTAATFSAAASIFYK